MNRLNIVITDKFPPDTTIEERVLRPLDANLILAQCRSEEEVIEAAHDADALMVQWAPITRKVIERLTRCQFISRYGIGLDMIDVQAAAEKGISVVNVPDYCIEEVAAHALTFLLTSNRKLPYLNQSMHDGGWEPHDAIRPIQGLPGQTLSVIGVGRLGRRVAELATGLGMKILGYDILPHQSASHVKFVDLDTAVQEADYLSLHCPLTNDTRHIINARVLAKMKPSAYLINVARGRLVDTEALIEALSRGQIAGAALDVFEQEPLPGEHPLRKMTNVVLTPHLAWYSEQALVAAQEKTAQQVLHFFWNGRNNRNTSLELGQSSVIV